MKNHSPTPTPTSYLVERSGDGHVSPHDLQRVKQALGLTQGDEVAMLPNWCGNAALMAQCGPMDAVLTCNKVDTLAVSLVVTQGVPQLQLVSDSAAFEGLMNELVQCSTIGLVLGEYKAGRWVGGVLLQARSCSVVLCFSPLGALARTLVQVW